MFKIYSVCLIIVLIFVVIFEVIEGAYPITGGMDYFLRTFASSVSASLSCYAFYKYSKTSKPARQRNKHAKQ